MDPGVTATVEQLTVMPWLSWVGLHCLWGVGGRLSVQVVRAAVIFSPRGEAKRKPQQIHEALERLDGQMLVALSSSGAALGRAGRCGATWSVDG